MSVRITGDGFAGLTLSGSVASIGIQGGTTGNHNVGAFYDVIVTIVPPPEGMPQRVRLGMTARLAFSLYRNERGIAVPANALRTNKAGSTYVLYRATRDGPTERVEVMLGHPVAQGIEVYGLSAGYVQIPSN